MKKLVLTLIISIMAPTVALACGGHFEIDIPPKDVAKDTAMHHYSLLSMKKYDSKKLSNYIERLWSSEATVTAIDNKGKASTSKMRKLLPGWVKDRAALTKYEHVSTTYSKDSGLYTVRVKAIWNGQTLNETLQVKVSGRQGKIIRKSFVATGKKQNLNVVGYGV